MTEEVPELITRIQALTREEAMEAALALAEELDGGDEPQGEALRFVQAVKTAPLQHIEETEELARIILVAAAADGDLAPTVREILDAIGAKAFILGGLEIVALAALAVGALHVIISKGRKRQKKEITLKFGPNGEVTEMVIHEEVDYGISANLGGIVAAAAGRPPLPGDKRTT
jgi:hypothetical protein